MVGFTAVITGGSIVASGVADVASCESVSSTVTRAGTSATTPNDCVTPLTCVALSIVAMRLSLGSVPPQKGVPETAVRRTMAEPPTGAKPVPVTVKPTRFSDGIVPGLNPVTESPELLPPLLPLPPPHAMQRIRQTTTAKRKLTRNARRMGPPQGPGPIAGRHRAPRPQTGPGESSPKASDQDSIDDKVIIERCTRARKRAGMRCAQVPAQDRVRTVSVLLGLV